MTVSLRQQIEEVEREIGQRDRVYARLVNNGKMRRSVADYQIGHMKAVLSTLRWLEANEADVREYVRERRGASPGS